VAGSVCAGLFAINGPELRQRAVLEQNQIAVIYLFHSEDDIGSGHVRPAEHRQDCLFCWGGLAVDLDDFVTVIQEVAHVCRLPADKAPKAQNKVSKRAQYHAAMRSSTIAIQQARPFA
jgi:hypothetical protein